MKWGEIILYIEEQMQKKTKVIKENKIKIINYILMVYITHK